MDSRAETYKHIQEVGRLISIVIQNLLKRMAEHDKTKLEAPEVELFDKFTPLLVGVTYNSDEYKKFLEELKPALDHHYAKNRHHPESFQNGIKDMNLVDILEMLCDWNAASKRHNDGNIRKSIAINQQRFGYSDELKQILINTLVLFE